MNSADLDLEGQPRGKGGAIAKIAAGDAADEYRHRRDAGLHGGIGGEVRVVRTNVIQVVRGRQVEATLREA